MWKLLPGLQMTQQVTINQTSVGIASVRQHSKTQQININQTTIGIVSVRQHSSSSCGSRQLRHQLEGILSTEIIRQHISREEHKSYTALFATGRVCNHSNVFQLKAQHQDNSRQLANQQCCPVRPHQGKPRHWPAWVSST